MCALCWRTFGEVGLIDLDLIRFEFMVRRFIIILLQCLARERYSFGGHRPNPKATYCALHKSAQRESMCYKLMRNEWPVSKFAQRISKNTQSTRLENSLARAQSAASVNLICRAFYRTSHLLVLIRSRIHGQVEDLWQKYRRKLQSLLCSRAMQIEYILRNNYPSVSLVFDASQSVWGLA